MKYLNKSKKSSHGRHVASDSFELEDTEEPTYLPQSGSLGEEDLVLDEVAVNEYQAETPASRTVLPPQPVRPVSPCTYSPQHPGSALPSSKPAVLPVDTSEQRPHAPRKNSKKMVIVAWVLVLMFAIIYVAGAFVFMDRFMPNTKLAQVNVSFKSSAEVQEILRDLVSNYQLKVQGDNFSMSLSSKDANIELDTKGMTDTMHSSANSWMWPVEIFKQHDNTADLVASSNGSGLEDSVRSAVDAFNKDAHPPTNATIKYDSMKSTFVVQAEVQGTQLDYDKVIFLIDQAVVNMQDSVSLDEDELLQPTVFSDNQNLATAMTKANTMIKADMKLNLKGSSIAEINSDLISQWINLGEDFNVSLNDNELSVWVDQLAGKCNTYGGTRSYTRADGKAISVSGGSYGWVVNKDTLLGIVKDGVASGRTVSLDIPCTQSGNTFSGPGGKDWGNRYIDVDLSEQYARFYDDDGNLVWETAVVTGIPDGEHATPEGVYVINNKESPSKLIGNMVPEKGEPEYITEVKAWMPFVGNYVGFHDASWQSSFGGARYKTGAGSHGCVNLPTDKAIALYSLVQVGDVVVVHN